MENPDSNKEQKDKKSQDFRPRKFGLRAKILILLVVLCIPVIGGLAYISVSALTDTINEDAEERANLIAQFFSADTNSLDEITYDHFQSEITKLNDLNPEIHKISIYAPVEDEILRIASTDEESIGEIADPEDIEPFNTGAAFHKESAKEGRKVIEAVAPIEVEDEIAATIGIYIFLEKRDELIQSQTTKILGISAFWVVALVLVLYLVLNHYMVKPVEKLAKVSDAVSRGDFNQKLDIASRDEFGDLCRSVNKMTGSLAEQSEQIQHKVDELEDVNRELQTSEGELQIINQQLETANRLKSQFLTTMSHELRTPLNSIIGFSELLEDETYGGLNDRQKKYMSNIVVSSKHLLQLINDILDLAKVESGTIEIRQETISLSDAMTTVKSVVEPLAGKKNISIVVEPSNSSDYVMADPARFKQILYNLISNAIKFTPSGGKVTLSTADRDGFAEVSVTDTGIGISKKDQKRIFSEFLQVEGSYSRKYEGTGLGLALTRKLVELHGGTIEVDSYPGKGSKFTFTIRLEKEDGQPPDSASDNDQA
jgi:signal transduction histidine kinase